MDAIYTLKGYGQGRSSLALDGHIPSGPDQGIQDGHQLKQVCLGWSLGGRPHRLRDLLYGEP